MRRYKRPGFFLHVLSCALWIIAGYALQAHSQSATATLSGTVVDGQGAVVADASVSLVNADTGLKRQVTTNSNGFFLFSLLPPGRYTALALREGFALTEVPGLVLRVSDHQTITLPLKVGSVNETVDVIHKPATSESTSVSMVIDRQFAGELPLNGRSFDSLLRLTPGTAITVAQSW